MLKRWRAGREQKGKGMEVEFPFNSPAFHTAGQSWRHAASLPRCSSSIWKTQSAAKSESEPLVPLSNGVTLFVLLLSHLHMETEQLQSQSQPIST